MNVLDLYRSKGLDIKKVASTHGGEYCGPCPGCGGDDRFRLWPEQNSGQGSFFCRGCGKAGDRVSFLMAFDRMSYPEACASLNIKLENQKYKTPRVPGQKERQNKKPTPQKATTRKNATPDLWVEKAGALVEWAHGKLMENDDQLAWLADRGIDRAAVEKFKLGWNPGKDGRDLWRPRESWGLSIEMKENKNGKMVKKKLWIPRGLVIPWLSDEPRRIRIRRPGEKPPRYYIMPGSAMDMMVIPGFRVQGLGVQDSGNRAYLVIESELDGIMCHARAGDICSVIALGSSAAKPDKKLMENLRKSAVILLSQDYDAAGTKAMGWWKQEFYQAKTWPVPEGADPGEAFQAGIDIRAWVSAGLPAGWKACSPELLGGVGRSFLDNDNKMDAKKSSNPVEELAGLLRKHPVKIHNTAERTHIVAPLKWQQQHWDIYQRISALVFSTPEVFRFISTHPAVEIVGENIKPQIDTNEHG